MKTPTRRIAIGVLWPLAAMMLPACGKAKDAAQTAQIKKVAETYVQATNRGDAAAMAGCWTEDGQFVNQSTGVCVKGRAALLKRLKAMFAEDPEIEAETTSLTVQSVAPDVAVAQGLSRFTRKSGPVESSAFVALYVQRAGQWKIHRVWQTDLPSNSHFEQLEDLAWMVGEWSDQKDGKTTKNVCRWTKNRNFITRTFEVSDASGLVGKGTEVIGWDPAEKRIRSWTFDRQGGFAEGLWGFVGDHWRLEKVNDHKPDDLAKHQEALKELGWLVGTWADRGEGHTVETTYKWVTSKAFLIQRFKVSREGRPQHGGVAVIGWDPQQKTIRSWMFDTDGGFAEALWSRKGDEWLANTRHVLPDGRQASSIVIRKKVGQDSLTWRRVGREVDGQPMPDGREVTVVRKPAGK